MHDILLGFAALLLGALLTTLGAWAYLGGRGAEDFFRRQSDIGNVFLGVGATAAFAPIGLGFAMIGIAIMVGKNTVTTDLLIVAMVALALGFLVLVVHPRWIRPRWARQQDSRTKRYRRWLRLR